VRVLLVLRKSPEGSVAGNALKYGTGVLNIDGCRVAPVSDKDKDSYDSNMQGPQRAAPERMGTKMGGYEGKWRVEPEATVNTGARWPANLVLEHRRGCRREGTQEGPGYTINRWDDGAKPFGGGAGHAYSSEAQPEEVTVWNCAEGCPVAALDEQSGDRRSAGLFPAKGPSENPFFRALRHQGALYDDTGGASRFFKQVGGLQEP